MNYLLKLIILGDYSVGKSSILSRYMEQREIMQDTTIGVDFKCKILKYEENNYKLHIWDTAGLEKFKSIVHSYFRDVDIVFFIFDVSCKKTFNNIEKWNNYINISNKEDKYIIKYLIGNKTDLDNRTINYEMGENLAELLGMKYFETSVKEQDSIDNIFNNIVIDTHKNILEKKINPRTYNEYKELKLVKQKKKKKKFFPIVVLFFKLIINS